MNSPSIPPVTAPATPKRKHGRLFYGCLASIGVVVFLSLAAAAIWMMAVTCFFSTGLDKRREGDWDSAITHYTLAIQLNPRHTLAHYERGVAFLVKDDCDKAIADLSKAIELDPKNAYAHCERGFAYDRTSQDDRAMAEFCKAIELAPQYARAYCGRGMAYCSRGDFDKAIADLSKAIELDPNNADFYRSRGFVYNRNNDYGRAIADCTRAIELAPRSASLYCDRGRVQQWKGDLDEAIADCNRALEIDPKCVRAYLRRGLIRGVEGDYAQAIADCTSAIEIDPKDGDSLSHRACVHVMQHRWNDALADYERSCEWGNPTTRDWSNLRLWIVRSQLGRKETANKELAAYLGQRGNAADPWPARIGEFLLGKLSEGDLMTAAASPYPYREQGRRTEGWYYAGMKRLLSGDKAGAVDCLRKCLATGRQSFTEYDSARAELKSLGLQGE